MDELIFRDRFTYIDLKAGGSVKGYRSNVVTMIRKMNGKTKMIMGHGSLANKNNLIRFKNMLYDSINWMQNKLQSKLKLD